MLVLRNAENPQSVRIYLNPASEDHALEAPAKSSSPSVSSSSSAHNQVLPKHSRLKSLRMSQEDAEEKALDLLFNQKQGTQCTPECTSDGVPFCEVCFATDESGNGFALLDCGHYFCADCWRWGIAVGLHDNNLPIRCMAFDCKALLHPDASLVVVPQTFAYRYRRMVVEQRQMRRDFATCTRCHSSLFIEGIFADAVTTKGPRYVVCECGQATCADCGRSPHLPLSCQRLDEYEYTMQENANAMELVLKPFMIRAGRCSGCGYLVIQTEGSCPHVHCRCGFEFCTNCERPWREHGNAGCTSKNAKRHEATEARLSYGSLPAAVFKNCSEWRLKASAGHKRKVLKHLKRLHGSEFANDAIDLYMELRQLVELSYAARYYRSRRANPRSDDAVGRRLNDLTEQLAFRLRQIEDSVVASTSKRNVEADNLSYAAEVAAKIIRMHTVRSQ
ncbi:hypothetical protein AAVH_38055 [Aphelenchoides avenae]|nr:hypothetical protein AAVH_38055 [Aphelenchus avenae]